jgi:hypothetical protein
MSNVRPINTSQTHVPLLKIHVHLLEISTKFIKIKLDNRPTFLNEVSIESIWPWRLVIGEIFHNLVYFFISERFL